MGDDEQLMRALAAGDEPALAALMGRWERRLLAFLSARCPQSEAEDLYQETWLRVLRSARSFDPQRRFSTWLFQIAVNLARDQYARRVPEPMDPTELLERTEAASQQGDPTDALDARADVRRLLAQLDPDQRLVVELRWLADLSEDEMSRILEIPRGTVKSRLHAAMKRLAEFLRETPLHAIPR